MDIKKTLHSLRRLESEHIRLVGELAKINKPLAASMLNVSFDVIDGLQRFNYEELKAKLMGIFEINRKSILTINSPLNFSENHEIRSTQDSIELTMVKANERKILGTLRDLVIADTDVAIAVCNINIQDAIALAETPIDIVEESVYANRHSGLLKLVINDLSGLREFLMMQRLSYAGIRFDRLVSH